MDLSDIMLISRYAQQFGPMLYKGKKYLIIIIEQYVKNGFVYDYNKFLTEVCEGAYVKRKSVLKCINTFVHKAWEQGFDWEWHTYVDWNENVPPSSRVAIQWLCEHYVPFVNKYQGILETTYSYYLRLAVKNIEK